MRRLSAAILALALAALCVAAASDAAVSPPRAALRGFDCQRALDPPNRAISVTAVMRPLAGTKRMQLKFTLLVTAPGSAIPSAARGGDLGSWISPRNPTLGQLPGDVWNITKSVVALGAPAIYRFRVDYRWIGAHDQVLGTATHTSWRCHQRELRPDLLVESPIAIGPDPARPDQVLYTATVDNAGATAAGPFVVQFLPPGGSAPKRHEVRRLPAFTSVAETFAGPSCTAAGGSFTIIADSASEVDDLNRANNLLTTACPGSVGGAATKAVRRARRRSTAAALRTASLYFVKQ